MTAAPEIRLLGPVEVVVGGSVVPLTAAKQRAVLARLALDTGRVVSLDTLLEDVWGDAAPGSARTTLKSVVSRLRRTLAEATGGQLRLVAVPPGYVLEAGDDLVDTSRFESLCRQARQAAAEENPAAAAAAAGQALTLWRGAPLADLGELGFAAAAAARLEEVRLAAVEDLCEAEVALGRYDDACAHRGRRLAGLRR